MTTPHCVFDATTGDFTGQVVDCDPIVVANFLPPNTVAVPDVVNPHARKYVGGQLVDAPRPPKPLPDADHEWDEQRERWRLTAAAAQRRAAAERAAAAILDLEARQARAMREHALGRGGTPAQLKKRLEDIDDQITELRKDLQP